MNYEEMLEKAYQQIPKRTEKRERFNPPKVQSFIQGNRTIFANFGEIANYLNRDKQHMMKYLFKELATSGLLDGNRLILTGKFESERLQKKVDKYIKEYVICRQCGSPDTKLVKEDRLHFIKCMACQAKYPVPKV